MDPKRIINLNKYKSQVLIEKQNQYWDQSFQGTIYLNKYKSNLKVEKQNQY